MAKEQPSEFDNAIQTIMSPIKIGGVDGGYDKLSAHLLNLRKMKQHEKEKAAEQLGKDKETNVKAWQEIAKQVSEKNDYKMFFPFTESMNTHIAMSAHLLDKVRKDLAEKGGGEFELYNNPNYQKYIQLKGDPAFQSMIIASKAYLDAQDELSKNEYFGATDIGLKNFPNYFASSNQENRRKMDEKNAPYFLTTPPTLDRKKQLKQSDLLKHFSGLGQDTIEKQTGLPKYDTIQDEEGNDIVVKTGQTTETTAENKNQLRSAVQNIQSDMLSDDHKFRMMNKFMSDWKGENWAQVAFGSTDHNHDGVVSYQEGIANIQELYNSLHNDEYRFLNKDGTVPAYEYTNPLTGEKVKKEVGFNSYVELEALKMALPKLKTSLTTQGGNTNFSKPKGEGDGSGSGGKMFVNGLAALQSNMGFGTNMHVEQGMGYIIPDKNGKLTHSIIPYNIINTSSDNIDPYVLDGSQGVYKSFGVKEFPGNLPGSDYVRLENGRILDKTTMSKYFKPLEIDPDKLIYNLPNSGDYKNGNGKPFNPIPNTGIMISPVIDNQNNILMSKMDKDGTIHPAKMMPLGKVGIDITKVKQAMQQYKPSDIQLQVNEANLGQKYGIPNPKVPIITKEVDGKEYYTLTQSVAPYDIKVNSKGQIEASEANKIIAQGGAKAEALIDKLKNHSTITYTDSKGEKYIINTAMYASAYYKLDSDKVKQMNKDNKSDLMSFHFDGNNESPLDVHFSFDSNIMSANDGYVNEVFGTDSYIVKAWIPVSMSGMEHRMNIMGGQPKVRKQENTFTPVE
jgi:predicted DNA binding CopG/RHH family protein